MLKVFLLIATLALSTGSQEDTFFKPAYSTTLHPSQGDRLLRQCSRAVPKKISGYWSVTQKEIDALQENFINVTKLSSEVCCIQNMSVRSLENYAFQYIGVTIKKKKYIYLNAFRVSDPKELDDMYKNWETRPIVFCDGGHAFWGVLFDISSTSFSQLAFNGVA